MWLEELISLLKRERETRRKIDPIITWRPWNPVAIKNVEPKDESDIEKGASMYSNPWKPVKIIPKNTVKNKDIFDLIKLLFNISWCDQVIETPEESNKIVFKRGILIGLKERIDWGGHLCPNSTVGEILLWKNDQKNDTKKKISETINRIIPVFSPFITIVEWFPWTLLSRWISRHHEKATKITIKNDVKKKVPFKLLIKISPEKTRHKAPLEASKGQGLISTKWKGLNLFINYSCLKYKLFYLTSVVYKVTKVINT
jgi:hypothetical protein